MPENNIFDEFLPDKNLEISEEHLVEFFDTMHQRQQIWCNRFLRQTKQPWSTNKILNKHKFCNVYRETDKTSQWIINNVIRNESLSVNQRIWRCAILRLFNNVNFFDVVDIPSFDEYDPEIFTEMVRIYEEGIGASTNKKAYAINSWLARGTTQGLACAELIVPSLREQIGYIHFHAFVGSSKISDLIQTMTSIEGIGKFIAHEWFLDLCYFSKYTNEPCNFDENTWTNVGPGAKFGLRVVTPAKKQNIETLRWLQEMSKHLLPEDFKYIKWNKKAMKYELCEWNITLHTIEFWLCEYAKYFKIKHSVGRQRDVFTPNTQLLSC